MNNYSIVSIDDLDLVYSAIPVVEEDNLEYDTDCSMFGGISMYVNECPLGELVF
jgi:hypothetical protein